MKKQSVYMIVVLLLIGFACTGCLTTGLSTPDLLDDSFMTSYFGIWHYPKNNIYYTITSGTLEAYMPGDKTGFTAKINNWKRVENTGSNKNVYKSGYIISATMVKMTGSWWIEVGGIDTWTWYMSEDKESIVTEDGVVYYRQ